LSLNEIFGSNLRNQRKAKELTQEALAARVGLSAEMISKIERGVAAPSFATVERIAEELDISEVVLFGVGLVTAPRGERGRLLQKIHATLSRMNSAQLARANKMLSALIE
jgi:transcriptional regulator with XRE-family HTH domain